MIDTEKQDGSTRHPWIDQFLKAPDQGLADFLAGYARIEPYDRAERPDAARILFHDQPHALSILDGAVSRFLEKARLAGVVAASPAVTNRRLLQIMDALRLVSLFELPKTASMLRKTFSLWKSWIERLPRSDEVDVRAEYLTTLALTQRRFASDHAAQKLALEPYWLTVCEQAGRFLPASYLQIGLLGLRLLPERPSGSNERPWLTGLARWATIRRPPEKAFAQQWQALKRLYPRTPAFWREGVAGALKQRFLRAIPDGIEAYWRKDVGLDGAVGEDRSPRRATIQPPPREPRDQLLLRAGEPLKDIILEANRVISQVEHFAEVTGDSHFLVRTACNLGMRLLESGPVEEQRERGKLVVKFARKALTWQPDDVVVWSLWRAGLAAEGRHGVAELVGWEAVRRFPEDPQRRNQLALLLASQPHRVADAEHLLRETQRRFPNDSVATRQLAHLLARQAGREQEAEGLWRQVVKADPTDALSRAQLEKLLSRRPSEAPHNGGDAQAQRRSADVDLATSDEVEDADDTLFTAVLRGGRLRRLAAYMAWNDKSRESALEEVEHILAADPNSSYARYLHQQLSDEAIKDEPVSLGSFGVVFISALRDADLERINSLQESYPDPVELYDVAKVVLAQDRPAARQTANWLARRPIGESRPVGALRGFLQQRLNGAMEDVPEGIDIEDLDAFLALVAANDNIKLDIIEAALAPWDLALVA